jgi:hypothetical protein
MPTKDTLVADFENLPSRIDLRPYISSLEDNGGQLTLQQVLSSSFTRNDQLFHEQKKNSGKVHNCWLKLHVRNTGTKDSVLTLFAGWHDYMYWYAQDYTSNYRLLMTTGLMKDNANVERWEHYGFKVCTTRAIPQLSPAHHQ